jgi:hypothetical protein
LNQILRRQTSRSHYGSKVPAVTVTVFKYRNKIGKIETKNKKQVHKKNKAEKKVDIENKNIVYVVFLILICLYHIH